MKLRIALALSMVAILSVASMALANARPSPPAGSIAPAPYLAQAAEPAALVKVTPSTTSYSFHVRSFEFQNSLPIGPDGGGSSGEAIEGPFAVTKAFDASTFRLQRHLLVGSHIKEVLVTLDSGATYRLEDVLVSDIRSTGSGGNAPTDRIAFSWRKIRMVGGGVTVCWNDATNSATC